MTCQYWVVVASVPGSVSDTVAFPAFPPRSDREHLSKAESHRGEPSDEDQTVFFVPVDLYHSWVGFRREPVQIQGLENREFISPDGHLLVDLIAASINDEYSVGPFIRPICTRCCSAMTDMILARSNSH